jgi:hypothetical protein
MYLTSKYGLYQGYDTSQIPQKRSLILKPMIMYYLIHSLFKLITYVIYFSIHFERHVTWLAQIDKWRQN